jgi:hypothetical protein
MRLIILILSILTLVLSCRPEEERPTSGSVRLAFDHDTLLFDTVFTGQASITQRLKVINTRSNAVNISSIRLGGMANSAYSLIINGRKANQLSDVYLRGNDSLLILATVFIDKRDLSLPFLITDSILFINNTSEQKIYLTAWGRDAIYYNGDTLKTATIWDSTSVRFINRSVYVPQGVTLTITKGTEVHATKSTGIIIAGTLIVNGDSGKTEKVTFEGPRLDKFWKTVPGQWIGLVFLPGSTNNVIDWAEIKNAETGILLGDDKNTGSSELKLTNTIIQNMSGSGILAYNTILTMWNSLITNCADYGLAVFSGGDHKHYNNTIANYGLVFRRNQGSVFISDGNSSIATAGNSLTLEMINNIIWGDMDNEMIIYKASASNWQSTLIDYNIFHTTDSTLATDSNKVYKFSNDNLREHDKIKLLKFTDITNNIFTIDSTSIAVGKGKTLPFFNNDLKAKDRGTKFDVGAYQH